MKKREKQVMALALSAAMVVTAVPASFGGTLQAASGGEAEVTIANGKVTIGNEYLEREFTTVGNKLATEVLKNKRADLNFNPADGSEEFIIKLREDAEGTLPGELDRSGWSVTASDQYSDTIGEKDGPAAHVIDGNSSTIWHSKYSPDTPYPHHLLFDMKSEQTIAAFAYQPRQDSSTNGDIKGYKLYVGNDLNTLESAANLAAEGEFTYSDRETIYVNLQTAKKGRYAKLVAVSPKTSGQAWATAAEVKMFSQTVEESEGSTISASDLTLDIDDVKKTDTENGVMVEFPFETFTKDGANWDITMKVVMDDGDHFMRKFLEIELDDKVNTAIDYIDLESMNVNADDTTWTHPEMGAGVGGMSGYVISLGQPVYIQGMFFGCEFPMTETEIDKNKNAHMRYFSGKNFEKLKEDNQLTVDGKYVTWQTVAGAARSTDMNVIQSDFYEYINSIATRTDFRTQYNSWYDNMMRINDENIESAFVKMEKGLSESGVEPMDSYVVDDGWNNYNSDKYNVHDTARCGTTNNVTGFWEFNNKFPNGFRPASDLAQSFGSGFGVWLGPRGGYNYNSAMGKIIQDGGYGAYNAVTDDIDVGDRRYVTKLTEFFTQMQDAYKVNYWKLDGFATQACKDDSHDHMTGGKNGMYYFSDTWEAWIDLFEALRANADKNGIDNLWLNLTCYVNPSPWILQWGNSVWIQNSQDIGRINVGQTSQLDQLLSYRDGRYFDFVKSREFQFPLANIYNHDPIYGKEGTNLAGTMTDDEFKAYLYMMGTRGTAFWELYYSPEMIDEGQKWEINAEYLEWAKANYHILRNAKLIGSTPDNGNTYGFSCWDGEEGIVSMRNPSATAKTLTFTLDRNIGVSESLEGKTLYRTTILNHKTTDAQTDYATLSYGDSVTITLQPGEARIWSLNTKEDKTAPTVTLAKATAENKVELTFSERVTGSSLSATVGGTAVSKAEVSASQRKVTLTTAAAMTAGSETNVVVNGLKDLNGNAANVSEKVTYYENAVTAKAYAKTDLKNADDLHAAADADLAGKTALSLSKAYDMNGTAVTGTADFSVSSYVKTTAANVNLVKQGTEYSLSINADGYAEFKVGEAIVVSTEKVNDGTWKHLAGVREKNGMLKVYVNGVLDKSSYEKQIKDLKSQTLTIGGSADLQMSEAEVKDATISLTAFEQKAAVVDGEESGNSGIVPDANGKIPLQAANISVKRADTNADVRNSESGPEKMIDGNTGTYACTADNIESDITNGTTSVYFEIDLGDVFKLDKIKMWRYFADGRTYKDTVVVASKDAAFDAKDTVLYSTVTKANEKYAYGLVSEAKLASPDAEYEETSAGKEFAAGQQEVRYIRIYTRGSQLKNGNAHGGNHICEVEVYGKSVGGSTAAKTYTIKFDTKGGSDVDSLNVAAGENWSLPEAPTRAGYVFKGWFSDVNCTTVYTAATPVSANLTLFADWEKSSIEEIAVTGVTLDKTTAILTKAGETLQLTATVAPADAANKKVNFKSSDEKVAKVDANGKITAVANGTATITVTTEDGNKTATCAVTVDIKDEIAPVPSEPTKPVTTPDNVLPAGTQQKLGKGIYKVLKADAKNGTVALVRPVSATNKTYKVPASVKLNGIRYKVTEISKNAFKNNKKLTKVTIGKNITKIGANAFSGAKSLKTIKITSKSLKSVGKNAFKGINKKATVKVPKSKKAAYTKILKKGKIAANKVK